MIRILLGLLLVPAWALAGDHHTRPSGYAVGLEILDAWYGSDDRSCDATHALNRCNGRHQCEVRASNRLCGDPHRGVHKSLAIRYSCGVGAETVYLREDQSTLLSCNDRVRRSNSRVPRSAGIEILRADYGAGRRYCDAGYVFADRCTGRNECRVYVSNDLCGDPFRGKEKAVEVEYRCGSRLYRESAREDRTVYLRCR